MNTGTKPEPQRRSGGPPPRKIGSPHQRPCIVYQRNHQTEPTNHRPHPGVSTNLALIFGTLLSSQGTNASFETLPGSSGRFLPAIPTLSDDSDRAFHALPSRLARAARSDE